MFYHSLAGHAREIPVAESHPTDGTPQDAAGGLEVDKSPVNYSNFNQYRRPLALHHIVVIFYSCSYSIQSTPVNTNSRG